MYEESNERARDGRKKAPLFFRVQKGSVRKNCTVKFSSIFHGNVSVGKELYNINCNCCVGESRFGKVFVGKSLTPSPTDLVSFL